MALEQPGAISPPRQEVLRRFLRILSDEQYWARLGKAADRILIVQPDEPTTGTLSVPFHTTAADEAMTRRRPDVIVAAGHLPTVQGLMTDGVTFCARVKSTPDGAGIPFILLTKKGAAAARTGIRTGADDVFPGLRKR